MTTPMQELIDLIPSASEIKQFIFDNEADEKMLDEWLWEKIYKNKNWIEKEKALIIKSHRDAFGCKEPTSLPMKNLAKLFDKQAIDYYNKNYKE